MRNPKANLRCAKAQFSTVSVIKIIIAFIYGIIEFRSSFGMTFDNDTLSPRSIAYDTGRDLANRLTFRRLE